MAKPFNRNDSKRRARRVLLWCAVVLCISPPLGDWLIDHCPLRIRNPHVAVSVSYWEKATPHPEILVLGSSRLGSCVRNGELRTLTNEVLGNGSVHIFNATLPIGEPVSIEFLTRRLLASNSAPPRLVILETCPDLLTRNNVYFDFIITRELTGADLPRYLADIFLSHNAISRLLSSRVTPFFRHRSEFLTWVRDAVSERPFEEILPIEAIQSTPAEGYSFQYVRDQGERNHVPVADRIRAGARQFESHLRPYQLAGGTAAAFEETVAMLRAHGCAIVLVEPPLCSAQRAMFTTEVRQPFDAFLKRLQTSYGCEFADYSATLPDTLFIDNHHLGNPGSFKFTELLAKEVVAPAWRKLVHKTGD